MHRRLLPGKGLALRLLIISLGAPLSTSGQGGLRWLLVLCRWLLVQRRRLLVLRRGLLVLRRRLLAGRGRALGRPWEPFRPTSGNRAKKKTGPIVLDIFVVLFAL